MSEVLDSNKSTNDKKMFSILSFSLSIVTALFCGYLIYQVFMLTSLTAGSNSQPPIIIIIGIHFFCIMSVIMASLSFITKEPSTIYKWIGAILSALLFLLIEGSVIFSFIMDNVL